MMHMAKQLDIKPEMKTITYAEVKKLMQENLSVRIQSNGLVFIGKKIEINTTLTEKIKHGVLQEEVYRLI